MDTENFTEQQIVNVCETKFVDINSAFYPKYQWLEFFCTTTLQMQMIPLSH